jgi:hypothetical protein
MLTLLMLSDVSIIFLMISLMKRYKNVPEMPQGPAVGQFAEP